jgi:hypothetical protein
MQKALRRVNIDHMPRRYLYIFLDEAGNLDFSRGGTKYFLLGALTKERPFQAYRELTELKYDLVEIGTELEYFHASENAQPVRNRVFEIIRKNLEGTRLDALIVEKEHTTPILQEEERFYPKVLGSLLHHILQEHDLNLFDEVIVYTDEIPVRRKRDAIEKAVKMTLSEMLPKSAKYRILHHSSKSNMDLQIVDYCTWAIYRKWDRSDPRSYELIRSAVCSEIDFFKSGRTF